MAFLATLSNVARSEGDPKIMQTGKSSLTGSDRLARALGWFSLGLGLTELFAPRLVTRALGLEGRETLVRAYGAREIGAGVLSLSIDKEVGLQGRVAGDALDLATLAALQRESSQKRNLATATAAVIAITLLDIIGAVWAKADERRSGGDEKGRGYRDRTGYPKGVASARGAARNFVPERDFRAAVPAAGGRTAESRAH